MISAIAWWSRRYDRHDKSRRTLIIHIVPCIPLGLEEHIIAWQMPYVRRCRRRFIAFFTSLVLAIDHSGWLLLALISLTIVCINIVWGLTLELLGQAGGVPVSSSRFLILIGLIDDHLLNGCADFGSGPVIEGVGATTLFIVWHDGHCSVAYLCLTFIAGVQVVTVMMGSPSASGRLGGVARLGDDDRGSAEHTYELLHFLFLLHIAGMIATLLNPFFTFPTRCGHNHLLGITFRLLSGSRCWHRLLMILLLNFLLLKSGRLLVLLSLLIIWAYSDRFDQISTTTDSTIKWLSLLIWCSSIFLSFLLRLSQVKRWNIFTIFIVIYCLWGIIFDFGRVEDLFNHLLLA